MKKIFLTFLLLMTFTSQPLWARNLKAQPTPAPQPESNIRDGFSFGVGWPYVGVKYFFNKDLGTEFRFSTQEGINVFALRGYWSLVRGGNFSMVTGLEGGYIAFDSLNENDTLRVSGTGYEVAPFCGLDYFLSSQFSLLFDFSMPLISVNYKNISLGDVQWVINGGLYFYPF